LKIGHIDPIEQLSDFGKPLRLVAHPDDMSTATSSPVSGTSQDRGKTRRLPAIVSLRQPLQPELEIGQPALGFGARQMPGARPFAAAGWLFGFAAPPVFSAGRYVVFSKRSPDVTSA